MPITHSRSLERWRRPGDRVPAGGDIPRRQSPHTTPSFPLLKAVLKGINPAKLTVDGTNGGATVIIDIQITGYDAAAGAAAAGAAA